MKTKQLIFLTGFLVGTLDILAAFADYYIQTGQGPAGVLRFIASGIFGNEAFTGSDTMIWWGLLFHFVIAFIWTILFFRLYRGFDLARIHFVLTAIGYGIIIWLTMNIIVLPLSKTPTMAFGVYSVTKSILILICMIGFPLVMIAKHHFKKDRQHPVNKHTR